jgi:NAD(P)H-dependent FMN reductase
VARNIAVIVGSTRIDSINRRLAKALIKLAPKDFEFEFVQIDDLPVFNQNHDQNLPEPVLRVKAQIYLREVGSREIISGMSASQKNRFVWQSKSSGQR